MHLLFQQLQLMQAFQQWRSAIAQDQTGLQAQRVFQNPDDVLDDQRLAAREAEARNTEQHGFIQIRFYFVELDALQARITGTRTFQTERTFQIAGSAGVNPEFGELLQGDDG